MRRELPRAGSAREPLVWNGAAFPGDPDTVRSLLARIVDGLGIRLVALRDNQQLVVSNLSMRLTGDELTVLAHLIPGERPPLAG